MLKRLIGTAARMLSALWRQWKLYPITFAMVAASLALYLFVCGVWLWEWAPYGFGEAIRFSSESFGWYTDLLPIADICNKIRGRESQEIMEAYGALGLAELWDGEIWRLLVSAFHHAFPMHIAGNLLVIWLLGVILEDELSRLSYIVFFLSSAILSVACQALALDPCVGLSGTGYAIFGALVVIRLKEPRVAMQVPRVFVNAGIASLLACVPITYFGILPIANIAHFSGFFYGLTAGWVTVCSPRVWPRWTFAATHVALLPLCWAAADPFWNEQYVEINMDRKASETDDNDERIRLLRTLQEQHPDDVRYRQRLVLALLTDEDYNEAWRVAVAGWDRSYTKNQNLLKSLIQEMWKLNVTPEERENSEAIIDEVLGPHSESVKDHWNLDWLSVEANNRVMSEMKRLQAEQERLAARNPKKTGPAVDEDEPGSAALGRRL